MSGAQGFLKQEKQPLGLVLDSNTMAPNSCYTVMMAKTTEAWQFT